MSQTVSRRNLARGAAWTLPGALLVNGSAPSAVGASKTRSAAKVAKPSTAGPEAGVVNVDPFAHCSYMARGTYFTTDPHAMALAPNSHLIGPYVDVLPNRYLPAYWVDRGLNTSVNTDNYTIPIYIVDSTQGVRYSVVKMVSWYAYTDLRGCLEGTQVPRLTGEINGDGSPKYTWANVATQDPTYGKVPLPSFAVSGGPLPDRGDNSLTVYDIATGIVRGYFHIVPQADGSWLAGGGYVSVLRPGLTPFGVRQSMQTDRGTSSVGGIMNEWAMVGASELARAGRTLNTGVADAGVIPHVTSWTFPSTKSGTWSWPAKQSDGKLTDANAPMMGQRFYLPKSEQFEAHLKTLGLSKMEWVVVRSLQAYGGIVTDQNYWTMALNLEHSISYTSKGLPNPYLSGGIVHAQFGSDLSLNRMPWEWSLWGAKDAGVNLPQRGEWYARTDLSTSYTRDANGDGTITSAETYSNLGYLASYQPRFGDAGSFELQHWTYGGTRLYFRLAFASDAARSNATVTIKPDSSNFTLNRDLVGMGLAFYVRFDGDPKYTVEMPSPTTTYNADGSITLKWASIPAGSANTFYFTGATTGSDAGDPANHYLIGARLNNTAPCA